MSRGAIAKNWVWKLHVCWRNFLPIRKGRILSIQRCRYFLLYVWSCSMSEVKNLGIIFYLFQLCATPLLPTRSDIPPSMHLSELSKDSQCLAAVPSSTSRHKHPQPQSWPPVARLPKDVSSSSTPLPRYSKRLTGDWLFLSSKPWHLPSLGESFEG